MNNIIKILFKLTTVFVKLIQKHTVAIKCKKIATFYCFDIFTSLFITLNSKFIPQTYNYGKNYPRSGIRF